MVRPKTHISDACGRSSESDSGIGSERKVRIFVGVQRDTDELGHGGSRTLQSIRYLTETWRRRRGAIYERDSY